jgi:hypothetical protein
MNILTKGLIFAGGVFGYAALGMLASAAHAATPGIPLSETACIAVAAQALTDFADRGAKLTAFRPALVNGREGCTVEQTLPNGSYIYASGTIRGVERSKFEAARRDWAKPPEPVAAKRQKARAAVKPVPKGPKVTTR